MSDQEYDYGEYEEQAIEEEENVETTVELEYIDIEEMIRNNKTN